MEQDLDVAEEIEIADEWFSARDEIDSDDSGDTFDLQSQSIACATGSQDGQNASGSETEPRHVDAEFENVSAIDVEVDFELEDEPYPKANLNANENVSKVQKIVDVPVTKPKRPRKKKDKSDWSKLPYGIVLEIFRFLQEKDRTCLARSCKPFYSVFHSPVLWRKKYVLFSGIRSTETATRSCVFINNFGRYIKHLEIECGHPTLHSARPMSLAVEMFLNHLSRVRGTKIISLKIDYMDFYHGWRFFELSRSRLIGALCKFMRKQRHLQFLDVSGAQIDTRDGSRVLKALAACYARNTIKTLQMKDFFELRYNSTNNSTFLSALRKFTALKEIYINFIYLNPSILEILGKRLGPCLELIRLVIDSSESQARTITASDWTILREKCPKLKVVFHFLGLLSYNEYTSALCRGIPLVECDILSWEGYPNDLEPDTERMSDILRHVANNFNTTLVRFRLSIDHCSSEDSLDQPMILLLQKCCLLTEFTVNATLSLDTVDTLCKIAASRKPKLLEHLELRVRGLSAEDNSRLIQLTQMYMNEIHNRQLAVELVPEPY